MIVMTDRTDWSVEKLIDTAQALDSAAKRHEGKLALRYRRSAFGARKWARTKVNSEYESCDCPNCGNPWATYCPIQEQYHCYQCDEVWEGNTKGTKP